MPRLRLAPLRVLPLALLSAFALFVVSALVPAQQVAPERCWASADTHFISVSAGGTQTIGVRTSGLTPGQTGYRVLGSFSGTSPGGPLFWAYIPLNVDRYFWRTYSIGSPFLPNGHQGPLDANGNAVVQVVIPPNSPSWLIGRTVHHAIVPQHMLTQQPLCSSQALSLTFLP